MCNCCLVEWLWCGRNAVCVVFGLDGGGPGGGGGFGVKKVSVEVFCFLAALLRVLLAGPAVLDVCCCMVADELGGSLLMRPLCEGSGSSSISIESMPIDDCADSYDSGEEAMYVTEIGIDEDRYIGIDKGEINL